MDVPGVVRERIGDEQRLTSVNVGGDDRIYVTPPRTLVYHASGLFSSESIDEYPHDAKRFDISADRREATFAFEYEAGVEAFSVPRERIETVLPPVLAGVLRASGWIDDDEQIEESYRFGERTLVVTDRRLLTSVGEAVWDRDHESDEYANVTNLDFEGDGFVVEVDDRRRRIDLHDEGAREAYETLESAVCTYHGVESVAELGGERERSTADEASTESTDADRSSEIAENKNGSTAPAATTRSAPNPQIPEASETDRIEFDAASTDETPSNATPETTDDAEPNVGSGDAIHDVESRDTADAGTGDETDDGVMAAERPTVADELSALRESVERQTERIERTNELLERLAEEDRATDDQ